MKAKRERELQDIRIWLEDEHYRRYAKMLAGEEEEAELEFGPPPIDLVPRGLHPDPMFGTVMLIFLAVAAFIFAIVRLW